MGKKLQDIYSEVKLNGGLQAQMRLAIMTSIPSAKAQTEPDSDGNLKNFQNAFKEITGKDCPIK